jgi:hypothetical protein
VSVLTANGKFVLAARISMPRTGIWLADLTVDATEEFGEAVTLQTFDGGLTLVGTAIAGGLSSDVVHITVVGGKGGLQKELEPTFVRSLPVRTILTGILSEAGETLSPTSDAAVLGKTLPKWTRDRAKASSLLSDLADEVGATWRVLADGTVWFGVETWPDAPKVDTELLEEHPSEDRDVFGVQAPRYLPGTKLGGKKLSLVVHTIDDDGIRTEVWYEAAKGGESTLLAAWRSLVAKFTRRLNYAVPWPCRVIAQNGDGTLELKPDGDTLPGLSRVPIRAGLPGVTVKVAPGARCYVEFEGPGDPRRPIARGWEIDGMTELQFGGAAPLMRQGDMSTVPVPTGFTFTATIQGLLAPPGGGPVTGLAVITVTAAPVPLTAIGVTGSGKAKA